MGHLGLTPQAIHKFGTYVVRAKEEEEARKLMEDARLLEQTGCFAIVLEKIPAKLAEEVTNQPEDTNYRNRSRRKNRRTGTCSA